MDADQVVRADLAELRDMDLEGAPYAYTPFCDDRQEMDGFRFWRSGYWANHLAGQLIICKFYLAGMVSHFFFVSIFLFCFGAININIYS